MTRKIKLSLLVGEYLRNRSLDYAVVLYLAAKNGEITLNQIYKICKERTRSGIRSWLTYLTNINILKRTAKATYTIGPKVEVDIEEARKVLEKHGIDIEKLEKENILNLIIEPDGKLKELEEQVNKLQEEKQNLLQELEKLRKENEELRREVEKLRSGVGGEDFEKLRREVEVLRKEKEQMLKELEELEEKSIELRKKLEQYRTIMKKLKSGIKILFEKAKTLKYYMIVKVENETLFLPIIDEEKWREILEKVGTIQEVTFTREGKREIKKGIIRAVCVCYDKQQ